MAVMLPSAAVIFPPREGTLRIKKAESGSMKRIQENPLSSKVARVSADGNREPQPS